MSECVNVCVCVLCSVFLEMFYVSFVNVFSCVLV